MALHDYSKVPAIVTIKNTNKIVENENKVSEEFDIVDESQNGKQPIAIPLFRTNLCYSLPSGDSLKLTVYDSTELIYFKNMSKTIDKIEVTIEELPE